MYAAKTRGLIPGTLGTYCIVDIGTYSMEGSETTSTRPGTYRAGPTQTQTSL